MLCSNMDESKKELVKPDISAPLQKRDSYLTVKEDEMTLVTVDSAEDCKIHTDGGIKDGVRVTSRLVITKEYLDEDGAKCFEYHPEQEVIYKETYSTSTFYLLKDFKKASHWPKEGIFYWVWKASDGIRWEQVP